jgi:hypothetical protein
MKYKVNKLRILPGLLTILLLLFLFNQCNNPVNHENMENSVQILFLHHSTGNNIWRGGKTGRIDRVIYKLNHQSAVDRWFNNYNQQHGTNYIIKDQYFPKSEPYGWKNYPHDYYNIWVKNAGDKPYMEEPTLEMLTKDHDVIIWKHCYPVGAIQEDTGSPDIDSPVKSLENYKLQYIALKEKMHEFPKTKFIVWTGAVLVKGNTNEEQAKRAKEFHNWVVNEWDEPDDNVFLWDFYELETDGGLYLKEDYAASPENSHPSKSFSKKVYPYFCQRIVDVIENKGDSGKLTGE